MTSRRVWVATEDSHPAFLRLPDVALPTTASFLLIQPAVATVSTEAFINMISDIVKTLPKIDFNVC